MGFRVGVSKFAILTMLVGFSTPALAQIGPSGELPGAADSSRIKDQIERPDFGAGTDTEIRVPELRIEGAPDGADKMFFTLRSIEFEGVTAYSEEELREVYGDSIGEKVSLEDFYKIAERIMRKYRNDGHIITQVVVPVQTIDEGKTKLRVVEGYIDKVSVVSDKDTMDIKQIRGIANQLTKVKPLTAEALERYLLIINDLPGVKARSVISPSTDTIGAADINIILERDDIEYLLGMDNFGSRYLGRVQGTAAVQLQNKFNMNERLTFQTVAAPAGNELYYGYFSAELPILNQGATALFEVAHARTRPGFDLEQFDVEGRNTTVGVEFAYPFIRTRNENLNAHIRFDSTHQQNTNNLLTNTEDDIRSFRIGFDYQNVNNLLWAPAVDTFEFEASKGIEILGSSEKGDSGLTRPEGKPLYRKITGEYQRLQRLSSFANLLTAVKGQWTTDKLLASEEFGIGGTEYGRGYDSSEVIGDKGYAAKVELQLNNPFEPAPELGDISYQLYGFYDWGTIWDEDATANSEKRNSVASTGLGARADWDNGVSGSVYVAFPLTRDVQTEGDDGPRIFAGIQRTF